MTKRINAKYKISRRFGVNLWGRDKDAFNTKNYVPGQHGPAARRRVASNYGTQLRAKQLLKGYYGNMSESQFRAAYKEAVRMRGDSSENLIGLLERRLDMVIYRMNFVPTVFAARQFVNHKHVKVNGKTVNIPSYKVKPGDTVEVKDKSRQIPMIAEYAQNHERGTPEYVEVDAAAMKGKFVRVPKPEEVPYAAVMEPNLVIEYYSR